MDNPKIGKGAHGKGTLSGNGHQHDDQGNSLHRRRGTIKTETGLRAKISSVRRSEVLTVLHFRFGPELPNDHHGRAALRVLLELGMPQERARNLAPWCTLDDLNPPPRPTAWSTKHTGTTIAELIGEHVELTFEEYQRLGPFRHIRPADAQRHEVDQFLDQLKRERDRQWRRATRGSGKRHDRTEAILHALRFGDEFSARKLADHIIAHAAFKGLDRAAAHRAVNRAIAEGRPRRMPDRTRRPRSAGAPRPSPDDRRRNHARPPGRRRPRNTPSPNPPPPLQSYV
jgi:hypothetical protein